MHSIYVSKDKTNSSNLIRNINKYCTHLLSDISIFSGFHIQKELTEKQKKIIKEEILSDNFSLSFDSLDNQEYDWKVLVKYLPGVNDNLANTAKIAIEDYLDRKFTDDELLNSSTIYLIKGKLGFDLLEKVVKEFIANEVIETFDITKKDVDAFSYISLELGDKGLEELSSKRHLVLSLNEMQTIRGYFRSKEIQKKRQEYKLETFPTDVELEAIAQTWSEHCKHKIFNARIAFVENGKSLMIDSLFSTYIKKVTNQLSQNIDWLVSLFSDNAGIIEFNEEYNIAFKVETHNSPSALDPYGGALTGILGVNRDILGVGLGARVIANTDIFCFAPPDYQKPLPEKILHPKRIFEGVVKGIEHGGNKSGIPTVNGSITFDENYLGKPLVYCGSVGIIPKKINSRPSEEKTIKSDDLIVIAGGRTGKDGIHGATFSSEELHEKSPISAVQIGDPFTQKKLADFIIAARDLGLYSAITDNGAGGFSSSVGEMALLSNGCEIHLDKAKLKAKNIKSYEILISESQERMTLAISEKNLASLQKLADCHEVEISVIGKFTDSGYFHILYKNQTVAFLELSFLHFGCPKLQLEAKWEDPKVEPICYKEKVDYLKELKKVLSSLNVCSKEKIVRRYDHEVQAQTIIKPLTYLSGPSDAAVLVPLETRENSKAAIAISHGICPKFSMFPYEMALNAVDEAIRNCLCVGTDFEHIAILDNFCWPDPIYHVDKTPDGKEKLGALVKANMALFDICTSYKLPIISGKDSMKNDYKFKDRKISIPYTLLISAIGKVSDYRKAISMEFKKVGDIVYVLGKTENELMMSEWALSNKITQGRVPSVDFESAKTYYKKLSSCIQKGIIASCHDISDGGFAISLAEACFASPFGVEISLENFHSKLNELELLFSESSSRFVISISKENVDIFEKTMQEAPLFKVGTVTAEKMFVIKDKNKERIIQESTSNLKSVWRRTLNDID